MSENALKLAEMLCTRLAHDIIGPIGALSNGAEFLREELGSKESQAAELIESSSKEAVARVQFYRQAYGYASAASPASLTEMKKLSEEYFASSKIKLNWDDKFTDASGINVSGTTKKIIFNVLILAASALIRGGRIDFEINEPKITITATGDKMMFNEHFKTCLDGKLNIADLDPRLVQCYYTYVLANESSVKINLDQTPERIIFSFNQ